MALYRRPKVQSDLANVIKIIFALQLSFFLLNRLDLGPPDKGGGGAREPRGRESMKL
jgi:hypothetical protein